MTTTATDIEVPFKWTCAKCGRENRETVNPELGPFVNLMCEGCSDIVEIQEMAAQDAEAWEAAIREADRQATAVTAP